MFVDFDGVMVNATVLLNGTVVAAHQGGYLPWSAELTGPWSTATTCWRSSWTRGGCRSRPAARPGGAAAVDYLQPGGIYRDVTLRVVPEVFVSDVFAKPVNVLDRRPAGGGAGHDRRAIRAWRARSGSPRNCWTEAARWPPPATSVTLTAAGTAVARLRLTGLGDVTLWSPDTPKLYTIRTTVVTG